MSKARSHHLYMDVAVKVKKTTLSSQSVIQHCVGLLPEEGQVVYYGTRVVKIDYSYQS